jgi:hypothetical protein
MLRARYAHTVVRDISTRHPFASNVGKQDCGTYIHQKKLFRKTRLTTSKIECQQRLAGRAPASYRDLTFCGLNGQRATQFNTTNTTLKRGQAKKTTISRDGIVGTFR